MLNEIFLVNSLKSNAQEKQKMQFSLNLTHFPFFLKKKKKQMKPSLKMFFIFLFFFNFFYFII